jgi:hypothetical protein
MVHLFQEIFKRIEQKKRMTKQKYHLLSSNGMYRTLPKASLTAARRSGAERNPVSDVWWLYQACAYCHCEKSSAGSD